MKQFSFLSVLVMAAVIFSSCSKEGPEGPAGATGAQGQAGPAGPAGPTGATGTANVTQYSFAPFVHTSSEIGRTFDLPKIDFEKSLLYVYVNPGNGFWYPLPGTTAGGTKDYRIYFGNPTDNNTIIYLNRIAGTGSETLNMRIVVIPAATEIGASRIANLPDMTNYAAVARHYNLPIN